MALSSCRADYGANNVGSILIYSDKIVGKWENKSNRKGLRFFNVILTTKCEKMFTTFGAFLLLADTDNIL